MITFLQGGPQDHCHPQTKEEHMNLQMEYCITLFFNPFGYFFGNTYRIITEETTSVSTQGCHAIIYSLVTP